MDWECFLRSKNVEGDFEDCNLGGSIRNDNINVFEYIQL